MGGPTLLHLLPLSFYLHYLPTYSMHDPLLRTEIRIRALIKRYSSIHCNHLCVYLLAGSRFLQQTTYVFTLFM
ncbi:hypothetical protein F5Y05DRAFT_370138 [Hypoxylon sp. FL0543]|nr:hypothetical protein F5Y05DRAFT_370138 [Hypoxylon sp. FL0543]